MAKNASIMCASIKRFAVGLTVFAALIASCNPFAENAPSVKLIPYRSGDKWGYINKEGRIVINPQFNHASVFLDDLALVKSADDQYGYIGMNGRYAVNPMYKSATSFSEGLACVVPENGRPQFIDKTGSMKFTVSAGERCGVFSGGLCAVKVGDKWGYINKAGEMQINPQFHYAQPFSEGMAAVAMAPEEGGSALWGFIDESGEIVINYQFESPLFDNNMIPLEFEDGLALVSDGENYGYINTSGDYVINPQFQGATKFKNGYAIFVQGNVAGYIDKEGRIAINPQFEDASLFNGNMAAVAASDGKYGYIDRDGKYIINPQFEIASDFFGDVAFVRQGGKWGIVDKKGKYLVNPQFQDLFYDFGGWRYESIESDYFDIDAITEYFLLETDKERFRGLSGHSTLSQIKEAYPGLLMDYGRGVAAYGESLPLNEFSAIGDLEFWFSENILGEQRPVYRTVERYDYWKGTYTAEELDHYEYIANENATLGSISFTLYLTDPKSANKSETVFRQIRDKWANKASMAPGRASHIYENNFMSVSVGGEGMASGNYASYKVAFKKSGY